ncbi:Nonribosomal peptide synthetase imqB [Pseudocercospora fuligena]|uniref:Nonribosomal peptide synthetase imqB n=1 Tax=Pseudocercospora fuligena TaxID=685502 RepID=A0A8H6R7J2_9PEZI|nr:Nonribosomal peptide synthetase imqB [Pseudocercospora fuligena]
MRQMKTQDISAVHGAAKESMAMSQPYTMLATQDDLEKIWTWNASRPRAVDGCVHDLVAALAQERPDALAIDAWDGQSTYSQLDAVTGRLAHILSLHGVIEGSIVAIYLNKSRWMPIAMLSIIKAGAAAVVLDTNQPLARLDSILEQTCPSLILTLPALKYGLPGFGRYQSIELDDALLSSTTPEQLHRAVPPSQTVYISFTSGTTGSPKGACMSHANVRSAVSYQGSSLGFNDDSRVLDFVPYSFDVAWSNFLHTICSGGCLCIATEQEMLQDLATVIASYRCTLINITPTVLRTLDPGPSTLQTILLSGEPPYQENILQWASRVRLVNTYGPTECTFKTAFSVLQPNVERPTIGTGIGTCTWLVDPRDHSQLVSLSVTGELMIEGPLVGQGYIVNSEATAAAFIEDPPWLLKGHGAQGGRTGKVYKTGDLFKYRPDGQLVFVGRKDTAQVKIRGQRVEVADVEHNVRKLLPPDIASLVEAIYPKDVASPSLAVFIETMGHEDSILETKLVDLGRKLVDVLPGFMLPTVYYPIHQIPLGPTGKADRRALRELASSLMLSQLLAAQAQILTRAVHTEPESDIESKLREIWADLLALSPPSISTRDNFFRLGGDSVKAIRMISLARRQHLSISISDILGATTLQDLARATQPTTTIITSSQNQPFSLLGPQCEKTRIRQSVANVLCIDTDDVEDILPCTPMQAGMVAMTSINGGDYILTESYRLPPNTDLDALEDAWFSVLDSAPLLRTRIMALHDGGDLMQIVLCAKQCFEPSLRPQSQDQLASPKTPGAPLFRVAISHGHEDHHILELQMHHAIFDGWSRSLVFQAVEKAYNRFQEPSRLAPFAPFVDHVLRQIERPETAIFWAEQLKNLDVAPFPPLSKTSRHKEELHFEMKGITWPQAGITVSTVIRTALALLLSKYTNSDDVVFGATVSGRQAVVPDIDHIAGPTIATVPVRVAISWEETLQELQQQIQDQMLAMHNYEQFGLHNICQAAGLSDLGDSGLFQLLLVVQHETEVPHEGSSQSLFSQKVDLSTTRSASYLNPFNSHGMMLVCTPSKTGVALDVNFDIESISFAECERFAKQLEHVISLVCSPAQLGSKVMDLVLASPSDVQQILEWNEATCPTVHEFVLDTIQAHVSSNPDAFAVDSAHLRLSYGELWRLSSKVTKSLQAYSIQGCRIPLGFEKSPWMVITMLAVLRAGGVAVPLSSPASREQAVHVAKTCESAFAITSRHLADHCPFSHVCTLLILEDLLESENNFSAFVPVETPALDKEAVIIFTSGTTNTSKGVLWSHRTLSNNICAAIDSFGLNRSSRIFQFSAYDFDVSTVESLAVLSAGGCLFIPEQQDIWNRLSGAIAEARANWICLTPSVADTLDPKQISCLETIVFAGEKLKHVDTQPWIEKGTSVLNWYGPAEASVATSCPLEDTEWPAGLIGRSKYARTWILDNRDPTKLAPIGTVGELCIEGDIVADGYIGSGDAAATQIAFALPPAVEHVATPATTRQCKTFRTGDHVKYGAKGHLVFMGRGKDTWTKIHGRRIQLHEIDEAAQVFFERGFITGVSDVIKLADVGTECLVLFLCRSVDTSSKLTLALDHDYDHEQLARLRRHLAQQLPAYMIPTYFIPVNDLPLGKTGKIDRRALRRLGGNLSRTELVALVQAHEMQEQTFTQTEDALRNLWATVLGITSHQISLDSHFFRLGGDSIAAMRLVSLAHGRGLHINTASVFRSPFLVDMASTVTADVDDSAEPIKPFSLLTSGLSVREATSAAARLCNVPVADVVDMYPCTPLQQGLLALTARNPGHYISRSVLDLQPGIDPSRLQQAWLATVAHLSILRTRLIDLPGSNLVQVVTKDLPLAHGNGIEEYIRQDEQKPMFLGDALCRATLIQTSFVLTIHHSIYDGTFLSMLLSEMEARYFSSADIVATPFKAFVRHISQLPVDRAKEFWTCEHGKAEFELFPQLPTASYVPQATCELKRPITLDWPHNGNTPTIIVRSAWALVVARFSMSTNVVFGTVLSGRSIDLPGIEHCAGPCVCTIPLLVCVNWDEDINKFQSRLRQQDLDVSPHQHYGVHNIARAAGKSSQSDVFQTLFVVHAVPEGKTLQSDNSIFKGRKFGSTLDTIGADPFNAHALMVSCWLAKDGLTLAISFDESVLTSTQVNLLAQHFERVLRQLVSSSAISTGSASEVNPEDIHSFWSQQPGSRLASDQSGIRFDRVSKYNNTSNNQIPPERQDSPMGLTASTCAQNNGLAAPDEGLDRMLEQASSICGVSKKDIEDLYPCTPLQESLIALSERRSGDYVGHDNLPLGASVDVDRFRTAWEKVLLAMPILRTRIIDIPGVGLTQIVMRKPEPWSVATTLAEFEVDSKERASSLGQPLARYAIISDGGCRRFLLTTHHAVYDGITNVLIRETLDAYYHLRVPTPVLPFRHFVDNIGIHNADSEQTFWKSQFQDLEVQHFPGLPSPSYQPRPDTTLAKSTDNLSWRTDGILPSTIVRSAWSLVCSRYASCDVVFGAIVSGRQAAIDNVDRICGPTIAAVPVRIRADPDLTVDEFLNKVQTQAIEMIPFEQSGIPRIGSSSDEAREACKFQSMLVIQPKQTMDLSDTGLFDAPDSSHQQLTSYSRFNSHALMAVCILKEDGLDLQFSVDSSVLDDSAISAFADHFAQVVRELCRADSTTRLLEIKMITDHEVEQIWQWNQEIEPSEGKLVHRMIDSIARQQPESIAVSAWDGELTYRQLREVSTSIAHSILDTGVTGNQIVPICFEKSVWTTAAFLGAMKAGCAVLLLEPSLPEARLNEMVRQAQGDLILSSTKNFDLSQRLCGTVLVIDATTSQNHDKAPDLRSELPLVQPNDTLYVIFTSGSTGVPKGCMISHGNMSTAVVEQKRCHRISNLSRVYDFSSYSFDAHHWVLLHTLCAGGTLCVPSEKQKRDHLQESLRQYQVSDLLITPATARTLDPAETPTLKHAIIVGDKISREELTPWAAQVKVTYAYGPSECSAWATSWEVPYPVPDHISIGKGAGQVTWIVDPTDLERLAPFGTIGELFLEGPLVGQGYLKNKDATRAAFVDSPKWLSEGSSSTSGRRGVVYRTGDLVKYDIASGNIIFVGRKDSQVKLHGKRLELGETEHEVLKCLATRNISCLLAAELVVPDATLRPIVAVFLQLEGQSWQNLRAHLGELGQELADQLPTHMLPGTFIPLSNMPLNPSGKINRVKLRGIGKDLSVAQLTLPTPHSLITPPATEDERKLQQMWAQTLHISGNMIGRNSNFFRVSGDSITAMQLMALARRQGVSLAVSEILANPLLEDMAKVMSRIDMAPEKQAVKPFSLLSHPGKAEVLRKEVAQQCGVDVAAVQDCYPCTAVQKSLLAVTSMRPGDYIARIPIEVAQDVDVARLRQAWFDVVANLAPVLRNRVLAVDGEGFVQAQLGIPLDWSVYANLETFNQGEARHTMGLGTALTRLALVEADSSGRRLCILTQHHAIYDGLSISLLLRAVSDAYNGIVASVQKSPFQNFVQYSSSVSKEKAKSFWRQHFAGCTATAYPALPGDQYQPQANSTIVHNMSGIAWPQLDVTPAIIIRAAWAILSARYTDSNDVVFGVLSTGRQAPVHNIEDMIAPLIAAMPVRTKMDSTTSIHKLLAEVQKQSLEMTPFEQTSMADIQASSEDAVAGAKFNTLLVVQHSGQAAAPRFESGPFVRMAHSLDDGSLDHFNPHAVMLMFQLQDSGKLRMEMSYDSNVVSTSQAKLLVNHFEQGLRQICASKDGERVQDISLLSDADFNSLCKWNASLPAPTSSCVHELFVATAKQYPDTQALCAWDGELAYLELNALSDSLSRQLVACGVKPGDVVPLCFEKSIWMPVAALGAMKAGAACVSVDCTQPEGRLKTILSKIQPRYILASSANKEMAKRLYDAKVVLVNREHIVDQQINTVDLPTIVPEDLLYVVFTSGSTGEPKGVTTTHQNFSSAVTHQRDKLKVYHGTRVFDFVSYSFDVAWSNLLNTLLCGATLCIPSEAERKNDIPGAFNRMRADYTYFTPTVARSLNPLTLPGLRMLAMGGEPIPAAEMARWRQVQTFIGIYGPAECAQALCITELTSKSPPAYVGTSFGARTWLVEPGRVDRLAPVGTPGELVIDGPAVATGYWKNTEMTKATFLPSPAWLSRFSDNAGYVYKTGDLLRYNDDGSLTFLGRKDQMVKLRGQRIELSEVEHNVLKALRKHTTLCDSVAAEVITPTNSKAPILAVFLALKQDLASHERLDRTFRLSRALEEVEEDIREVLPQYMIPGAYITLDEMPMTTTNKIDRRALRTIGGQRKLEDLASMQLQSKAAQKGPSTDMEKRLQQLWSQILGIDSSSIKSQSSFLRIGGESISAMRLVAAARQAGISFTVADIFRNPRLSQLAEVAKEIKTQADVPKLEPRKPFSLLPEGTDDHMSFLYDTVEPLLGDGAEADDIQDVLPVTDFQELAVRENLHSPPGRLPHFILDLPKDVDVIRLRRACKRLSEHFEILRTVFVEPDDRLWQVQLSHLKLRFEIVKAGDSDVDDAVNKACEKDLKRRRKLGESSLAFMIITSEREQGKLVIRLSHAQFDDHSLASMFKALTAFYLGESIASPKTGFGDLITYNEQKKAASISHWSSRLRNSPPPDCASKLAITSEDFLSFQQKIPLLRPDHCQGIPLATIFHAACSVAIAKHYQRTDIVMGRLVTGRAMLPVELQDVVGPCLVEQPIRYQSQSGDDLFTVARAFQRQFIEDSSHEAVGMVEIIRGATDWPTECCDFGWRTAFQQEDGSEFSFLGQEKAKITGFERPQLPRLRPEIYATPKQGNLELAFEGNRKSHKEKDLRKVVGQIADLLSACTK